MIKGWVRFAKPVGTIKIKNSIPNSSQEKNHKVNPDKQEENNNKDTCRNNEVEVKKAERKKEPKFWFLEKNNQQIVSGDFQQIPLRGKSQVHKNVFCLLPCKKEREIKHTMWTQLFKKKDKLEIHAVVPTEGWVGAWGRWSRGMCAPFLSLCLVLTLGSVLIFYLLTNKMNL